MPRLAPRAHRVLSRPRLIGALVGSGGPESLAALGPIAVAEHRPFSRLLRERRSHEGRYGAIAALADEIAVEVDDAIREGARAVVLGGDHSIAIGTWKGVARAVGAARFGLVWLDAHMDAHTPATSPSGNIHGMPLAVLLGYGDLRLVGVARAAGVLDPDRTVLVGVRSFEPEEARLLDELGVRCITMAEVRRRGATDVLDEAFRIARGSEPSSGLFGLSVDVDVIDPRIAPGVSTPAADGLGAAVVVAAVEHAAADPRCVAIELAELDPSRDRHGRTVALVRTLVDAACSYGGVR